MFKKLFAFGAKSDSESSEEDLQERSLIRAAQQGDHAAFRMLYESYHGQLYNLTYYTLKDSQLAEDTLQSIFLKIYHGLPSYRFESSFRTWAYRIALNEAKNQLRNRKSDLPLAVINGTAQETHVAPGPHEEQLQHQREEIVRRALMELPPKMRTVIVLKYVDGLSYDEIASVLNCSAGTVASRLNRALEKLESLLAPFRSVL
jgi:RNA polymerase sigma-70 factor (ECF subfamily)